MPELKKQLCKLHCLLCNGLSGFSSNGKFHNRNKNKSFTMLSKSVPPTDHLRICFCNNFRIFNEAMQFFSSFFFSDLVLFIWNKP